MYPNKGSCKLYGETPHLAKDCKLRTKNSRFGFLPLAVSRLFFPTHVQLANGSAASTLLGTGREARADKDDFHMIRRRNLEIDGDEREEAEGATGWCTRGGRQDVS